jgi:capsule polysaccharide export protein KpsE/RkpR
VRSLQARVEELQRQLQKLGGKAESAQDLSSLQTEDLYPSMRRLPVLGVEYADLYRRQKIDETVFETLTKQYELAKVEEARETPSVKVLDEGDVPERKSFPPRTLFALLGVFFFVSGGCLWTLAKARWQKIDPHHPGKILAQEVFQAIRATGSGMQGSRAMSVLTGGRRFGSFHPKNHDGCEKVEGRGSP